MKKWIALLLCVCMLLTLTACMETPVESSEPTVETSSNEELARDMYAQARASLDSATDVSLELVITTVTEVAGNEISHQALQILTYQGIGTDDAMIALAEDLKYDLDAEKEDDDEGEKAEEPDYQELWYQDQLYVKMTGSYRYSGAVTAEDAAVRYTPVVLLDAALYGSVTCEETEEGTRIAFAQASNAETWALPEEAIFEEASGSALLDETGALTQMDYTITYTYGPVKITTTVQSKPLATAEEIAVPEDADQYLALTDVDAMRMTIDAMANLVQADSITYSNIESLFSEAAGVMQNQSVQADIYGHGKDVKLKAKSSIYFMDYSTGKAEEYEVEDTFMDGKLTTVINKGLPSTSTMAWGNISDYVTQLLLDSIPIMDFWQDATITDMGSLYLLEFQLNENFGNTMQNVICESLWEDPSFLINLSSKYENAELNGYLSVDKYTGLAVATGYYYEGVHTIEGQDYAMTMQYDQSMEAPSLGAYKEITGKMLPEEEPENKATPLFYHVTGASGQEMWLLGTIHVGDERTAYLPEEIYNAFAASDALALECNTELFDEQLEEDEKLAEKVSNMYFLSNGKMLADMMEEEEYQQAVKLMKAIGSYNMNMPYAKPCLWSDSVEQFYLRQGYSLHRDQGVEERLTAWADELDKEIWEVESNMFQLQMLTGWSDDLQLWMLSDALQYNGTEYWQGTQELYELWCAGDETALREALSEETDTSEWTEEEIEEYLPLVEEYNKAMSYDRNEGMLDVAIEYLESGDVVFYAVGLAHLLDSTNGLVDTLRDAGYTVELVTYAN